MHKVIETSRLFLRRLTPEVYNYVFTTLSETETKAFFGITSDADLEEERKKYRDGLSMYNHSFLVFQLIDKVNGSVIGSCGFFSWYLAHKRAEIGYVIADDKNRGQGYMKEAMEPVIGYGFNEMGLNKIDAFVDVSNEASFGLLEKFGFKREGVLSQHYIQLDKMVDVYVMSLLKSQFI